MKEQLKNLKNTEVLTARPSWVLENKKMLMSQIAKTTVETIHNENENILTEKLKNIAHVYQMLLPKNIGRTLKPVFTTVLALIITSGGWIASAYAEPGDIMWSTKKAISNVVEQGQLVVTSKENKASLNLEFASKRAQVLKEVADSDANINVKTKIIRQASDELQQKLDTAKEELKDSDVIKISDLVKDVALKTQEISSTLKEVASQNVVDASLSKELSAKAVDVSQTSLQMVERVLEKKVESKTAVSEEEKIIIKDHLATAVEEIKKDTEKAKEDLVGLSASANNNVATSESQALNTTSTLIKEDVSVTTTNTTTSSVELKTTTPVQDAQIKTTELTSKVAEMSKAVESEKTTVTNLVETNILEAVKKTIELKTSVDTVSKEVVTTKEQILTTTPVIPIILPVVNSNTSSVVTTTSSSVEKF